MNNQILYDLIVHDEWVQDPIVMNCSDVELWQQYRGSLLKKLWKVTEGVFWYAIKSLRLKLRYQTSFWCPPHQLAYLINKKLEWNISLSSNGSFLAVLQDDVIEIRSLTEDSSSAIANCKIEKDLCPQWRKIAWSSNSSLISYSNSFGDVQVFDLTGTEKCVFHNTSAHLPGNLRHATSCLFFIPSEDKQWSDLLFIISYQGKLKVYNISEQGNYEEKFVFSFAPYHPYGIVSAVYDFKTKLLIVAGCYGKEPFESSEDSCYGSQCAISMWRFLSDNPYLTLVEDRGKSLIKVSRKELLQKFVTIKKSEGKNYFMHGIHKICLSPDSSLLVALHLNGRISLWQVPSMKLIKTWDQSEQPISGELRRSSSLKNLATVTDDSHKVIEVEWWSTKELIVAHANGNLTISSSKTLANMLGDLPEQFDPWPIVSQAVEGYALILECEKIINETAEQIAESPSKAWLAENDDDHSVSINLRAKEIMRQLLYFLTEAERFQPSLRKPRTLTHVYRLVCLKSTTPEDLFSRKIELEHYGEALDLALRFKLNTDPVYQWQWKKKPVSKITIHDYLTKIKDRFWVLDECLLRVADDFDSTEELIKYGLLGTSWEVLQNIDSEKSMEYYIEPQLDDRDVKSEKVFSGVLSQKQLKICKYRLQLLHFLDRLSTYEVILGGSFKARDKFNAKFFSDFRSCNIVHQAIKFAHEENSYALEDLFSYHGEEVLPHWLPILSNFPETANVKEYEPLIPEVGEIADGPEILPWLKKHHREIDWVEQKTIIEQIQDIHAKDDLGAFIYETQPDLLEFKSCSSKQILQKWFFKRIFEIDEKSKLVDCCLQLTNVGIQRGIQGLKNLQSNLETLRVLVYDVNIDNNLTLKEIIDLPHISKMKLLMSKTSDESFIRDFKELLNPYLLKIEKKNGKETRQKLTHQFMVDIAISDLTCCLKLLQNSSPEVTEPLIADVAERMKLAMDCIYACKRHDQLNIAFSIVECLPAKEEGCLSHQIQELHLQLDQLELLLGGAEVLEYHLCPKTIGYLLEIKDNPIIVKDIIHMLLKNTSMRSTSATFQEWNTLLKHIIKLSKTIFTCFDEMLCHQTFAACLLRSGCMQSISLAGELLTKSKQGASVSKKNLPSTTCTLSYETSIEIVLAASQEYFNAATSVTDFSMEYAKFCLSLIVDHPECIQAELDLIQAAVILQTFGVSILPLQVRLCVDRVELIDLCLQKSKTNYKKVSELQKLGSLLQICGDDHHERDGKITLKVAESSFSVEDFDFCAIQCFHLIDISYSKAWQICKELGESTGFINNSTKLKMLSFALTYCPVYHIEEVLKKKNMIDREVLYEQLQLHLTEEDDLFEDTIDGSNQSLIKHTKSATKRFLHSMGGTNMLSKAIKWVKQSTDVSSESSQQIDVVDAFLRHPFYCSLGGMKQTSFINIDEFYPDVHKDDATLFHCLMLRHQKLIEQRDDENKDGNRNENVNTTEDLQSLAELSFPKDSLLSLGYMLYMQGNSIDSIFQCQRKSVFTFIMAAYTHALHFYSEHQKLSAGSMHDLYRAKPLDVIRASLIQLGEMENSSSDEHSKFLISNLTSILDMLQAQMLLKLGKGVDIERFTMDNNYKKETILGLAMSCEEEQMNICLLLAQKYDIQRWEIMLSFVEFLFTDSGLKAKTIRDLLNKWSVEEVLKGHNEDVFFRFQKYIYPEIDGYDHNMLLLFYVFALNCTSCAHVLQGNLSLDAHVKLLKKIKAAASAINYKDLVHGGSPLEVIKSHIKENNVHLLAKIASKIPQADGSYVNPNKVFLEYAKNEFWSTKNLEKVDWIHRFEACQKIFTKLELTDVVELSNSMLFTEPSIISIADDSRQEIAKRILKFVRQQKRLIENNFKDQDDSKLAEAQKSVESIIGIINHLECMKKVKGGYLLKSSHPSKDIFVRKLDMSAGDLSKVELLCSEMFVALEEINFIGLLAWYQTEEIDLHKILCQVLKNSLEIIESDSGQKAFQELVHLIKVHQMNSGNLVTAADVLDIARSFCSDINVATHSKTILLQLLNKNIDLSSEDMHLLMYFQSDAIIAPKWHIKIDAGDVKSMHERFELFKKLADEVIQLEQIAGLKQLLFAWPPFVVSELQDDPWLILICKQISYQQFDDILPTIKRACFSNKHFADCYKVIYEKLCSVKQYHIGFKVMLLSHNQICYDLIFKDKNTIQEVVMDGELFNLIMETKSIHRIAHTTLFESTVSTLLQKDEQTLNSALEELSKNGHHAEAATIHAQFFKLNPSFMNLNNAIDFAKKFLFK